MLQLSFLVLAVTINFFLGLFVLLRNPRSATYRLFFLTTIFLDAFLVINAISLTPFGFSRLVWIRLDLFSATYLFLCAFLTFRVFPAVHFGKANLLNRIAVCYTVIVSLLTLTPLIFARLTTSGGTVTPVPTPAIMLFVIQQVGLLGLLFYTIFKKLHAARGREQQQLKLVVFGLSVAFSSIIVFNLILVQVFKITSYIYLSNFASLFFTVGFAYAMVRQRLFDIRFVVARAMAYFLLLVILGTIYSVLAFEVGQLLFRGADQLSAAQRTFNIAVAIMLAFTFQPLRRLFEKITDRIFYRDKYDPEVLLSNLGKTMASEIELEKLGGEVIRELSSQMRLSSADLLVVDHGKLFFTATTKSTNNIPINLTELAPLPHSIITADDIEPGQTKDILDRLRISASVPLQSSSEFIGWLLLGEKRNGDIFNRTDIRMLTILANELAVAIHNAKNYTQIQHFNQTLQNRIAEATKQLRDANAHLQQLDAVKDEFISMASHQLGTPLTVVDGYISMLGSGIYGPVSERQRKPLEQALHRVRLMKRLVADFLNVSRMEAGRFFIDLEPTDLNKVVPEEVEMLLDRAREKQVALHYTPPNEPVPVINIDEQKTRQAIMNLIDNAVFYTPRGLVKVSLEIEGQEIVFKVTDNGIGVPGPAQKLLFSKFYRAPNAKRERPNGTGIGLYLVKRVIQDQGGSIFFESTEHKGSTFGFKLPMKVPVKTTPTITKPAKEELTLAASKTPIVKT